MNALLVSLKSRTSAKSPLPADLQKAVLSIEAELADLQTEYGGLSLDAYSGVAGADKALETLSKKLGVARDRAATLKAAHSASLEREAAAVSASRAALQRSQFNAASKHLDLRDAAAGKFSKAIAEASAAYRELQTHNTKARGACPIGMSWPGGTTFDEVRGLAAAEFWRHSDGQNNQDGLALPGAGPNDSKYQHNPTAIPDLKERLEKETAWVKEKLKSKLPE
jgi:hypothetical protein